MAEREIREVRATDAPVSPSLLLVRIVYFIVGVIITLLALRLLLLLLAANRGNPFVDFIYDTSNLFASPFYGIFNYQPTYGQFTFEISTVVAILIYALIGWGIAKLVTIASTRHDEI